MKKVLSIAHSSLPSIHNSMFSSNKISQHNLNSNIPYRPYTIRTIHTIQTQHCSWTPQFWHTGKTGRICHAQYSKYIVLYIAATHNISHSPCTSTSTHHTAFHNPLHTTNKHTKHICVSSQNGTRCRDGVKVLWCHSI